MYQNYKGYKLEATLFGYHQNPIHFLYLYCIKQMRWVINY